MASSIQPIRHRSLQPFHVLPPISTGACITISHDDDPTVAYYYAVVFGDVNGDGKRDGTDALKVSLIVKGMLTREQVGDAVWMAADLNHDGTIDKTDVELLIQEGLSPQNNKQNRQKR